MKRFGILLLALFAVASLTPSADAAFKIQASIDGGAFVVVEDNVGGGVPDSDPAAGSIVAIYSLALAPGVTLTITTGASKPLVGGPAESKLDISIDGAFSAGPHELIVEVTDTGFAPPGHPTGPGVLTSVFGATDVGDMSFVSFQSWLDNANNEFGIPGVPPFGTPLLTVPNTSSFALGTAGNPYSLTNRSVIRTLNGGDFSFDSITTFRAIPEPASMAIWSLIGGIGAVAGWRRSRRKA